MRQHRAVSETEHPKKSRQELASECAIGKATGGQRPPRRGNPALTIHGMAWAASLLVMMLPLVGGLVPQDVGDWLPPSQGGGDGGDGGG
mmetsp:Transcript_78235/g.162447  ORF Transcript_78235/g.162447 Transcript_78235/m.162447 type:complete len:89 (-) Transcript_78235:693-959(-)